MPPEILSIQPWALKFSFEPRKQISSSLQLMNTTDTHVAFKVKTTAPKKYCVRPNAGIVLPGASITVTVTMQAQQDAPPDMHCKDKFLIQSAMLSEDADHKQVSQEMFRKESGVEISETKLKVIYVSPPQPPSPILELSEEGLSPRPSLTLENSSDGNKFIDLKEKLAEAQAQLARITEEKKAAIHKSQKLQEDLQRAITLKDGVKIFQQSKHHAGFSLIFVLVIGLLGFLFGYIMGR